MPTFIKKKTGVRSPGGGRRFMLHTAKKTTSLRTSRVTKSTKTGVKQKADSTIDSLNVLLERDERAKVSLSKRNTEENAVFVDEPEAFDGISTPNEAKDLYDQALSYERKKARSVEDQIKVIESENEKEKRELEAQIRELKRELHRTAPLHDTKFFSLTKELKAAIEDLDRVASTYTGPAVRPATSVDRIMPVSLNPLSVQAQPVVSPVVKTVTKPVETVVASVTEAPAQPVSESEKKSLAKKKTLVTGVSAVILLFVISGAAGMFLSKPKVDEKLVAQYLPQAGQVQGAQTSQPAASPTTEEPDPSQADINFEQSVWADYNDGAFGITLQYPKNAVKVIRTDSNITFIRKTGYLFKVQRIETSFTADEYWKQIQATSLNYVATSEKFKGKVALKLELEDMTDYPGDRYLIKEGKYVYDVWYATSSSNFTPDDIKLADKMLASLSVVGATEF